MSKNIEDLRAALFDTIEQLKSLDKPMEIDRAKAIVAVSQQLIESAKVECKMVEIAGGRGSGFIPDIEKPKGLPNTGAAPRAIGNGRS